MNRSTRFSASPISPLLGFFRRAGLCAAILALTLGLLAQSVHWDPPGGKLPVGLLNEVTLTFENCEPKGDPAPPKVPGLMLALRGKSQSISIINFTKTASIIYGFAVRLENKQGAEIPAFTVETDKGPITVPAVSFEAGQAAIGQSNLSIEEVAQSHFILPAAGVWAGEVFTLQYQMDVLRRYYHQIASAPEWDSAPLVVEEWAKPELAENGSKPGDLLNILYHTRAYAKQPGTVTLNGAQQLLNIRTGSTSGFFGATPELQQLSIASDQPSISVRPLPTPAPTSFAGAVGQFKLASKVVPLKAKAGEPITWTLELSGTGNWPAINSLPGRSVPKSFEVIQPQAKRTMPEGKLFDGTLSEDVVMLPRQAGTYTIPPLSFSYFDPKAGIYRTITTDKAVITVDANVPTSSAGAPPSAQQDGKSQNTPNATPPAPPAPPAPLPSDPIVGENLAEKPNTTQNVATICAPILLVVPFTWLLLALFRALAADPARPSRQARASLRKTLRQIIQGTDPSHAFIKAWQQDAARALGLTTAAPSTHALVSALGSFPKKDAQEWLSLWKQADSFLFGNATPLPKDWTQRAQAAVEALTLPRFNPLKSVLPRNLLPWFFAICVFGACLSTRQLSAATNPNELYAKGDFANATTVWEQESHLHPTNWVARHNLGISLLQQNQAGAAVAHLTAALVQNPSSETIRQNFRLATIQAGVSPSYAGDLASDNPLSALARLAPPAIWQRLIETAALLATISGIFYLLHLYKARISLKPIFCLSLFVAAILLAGTSLISLHRYGPLVDTRAALVRQNTTLRSIPTEADATQKTSAILTGTLTIVDKSFLGWKHVTLSSGDGGWLREADLIALWSE